MCCSVRETDSDGWDTYRCIPCCFAVSHHSESSAQGWVGQIRIKGIQAASCKHLKQVRGEAAEATRCQTSAGAVANPSSKGNKNSSIVQKVSLAQKWKPSIDPSGYLMSEKLDGMRAYWCGKKLWTRSGLPVIAPEWFTADLPSTVELDGELFLGRKLFGECVVPWLTRRLFFF